MGFELTQPMEERLLINSIIRERLHLLWFQIRPSAKEGLEYFEIMK
jgi:hypothetical protein